MWLAICRLLTPHLVHYYATRVLIFHMCILLMYFLCLFYIFVISSYFLNFRQAFPTGERVTFTGKECLCQKCSLIPVVESRSPQETSSPTHTAPCKCFTSNIFISYHGIEILTMKSI